MRRGKNNKSTKDVRGKRWSGQFSSSSEDNHLNLAGIIEHEQAMENSKCTTAMALSRLKKIDPAEWTVMDVGVWLDWLGMSEYRAEFMKNAVSGAELKELDVDDFISLGVTKVGHRKKLEKRIKMLQHGIDAMAEDALSDSSSNSSHSSSVTSATSSSSISKKVPKF